KEKALAERQAALERAAGLRLAAQASSLTAQNPGLSLLLALEAEARNAGPLVHSVLVEALKAHRELRVFQPAREAGSGLYLSRDGSRLLAASWGSLGPRVWDTVTGTIVALPRSLRQNVTAAAFSPNNEMILLASQQESELSLCSGTDGRFLGTLRGHSGAIVSAVFTPDGTRALTASDDRTARVWDLGTGNTLHVLDPKECSLSGAILSPDGRKALLLSSGYITRRWRTGTSYRTEYRAIAGDTVATLWDIGSGQKLQTFGAHHGKIFGAFHPDGSRVVTASEMGSAGSPHVWDAASGRALLSLQGTLDYCSYVVYSPDGSRILGITNSFQGARRAAGALGAPPRYAAVVWDAATGQEVSSFADHRNQIVAAAFHPNGSAAVTASRDGAAWLWEVESGRPLAAFLGHDGAVQSVVFRPDGATLCTTSLDGTARVWDAGLEHPFGSARLPSLPGPPTLVSWGPNGRRLFAASESFGELADAATGEITASLEPALPRQTVLTMLGLGRKPDIPSVHHAIFSEDGARVLIGRGETVEVRECSNWNVIASRTFTGLDASTSTNLYFSPSGTKVLAVVSFLADFQLLYWDLSGKPRRLNSGPNAFLLSAEFDRAEKRLLVLGSTSRAEIWDLASRSSAPLQAFPSGVSIAALSPTGTRAALDDGWTGIRLCDAANGWQGRALAHHTGRVTALAFSADGSRLLSASEDKTACIWDASSGEALFTLEGHNAAIEGAALSPDGTRAFTFAGDQTVRTWDATTGAEWVALRHPEPVLSARFRSDGGAVLTVTQSKRPYAWPLDLVAEARSRHTRELSPREMARFDVGTPAEREARIRELELREVFQEIELATKDLARGVESPPSAEGLPLLLERFDGLKDGELKPEMLERARGALASAAGSMRLPDPNLLGALAEVESLRGQTAAAIRILEDAIVLPGAARSLKDRLQIHRAALAPDLVSYASVDAVVAEPFALVPPRAEWRYFRGREDPCEGLEWTTLDFDDRAWESGITGLGYGDNDDATLLADMARSYTTLYVRRRFEVESPDDVHALRLVVLSDDGFVAYLNGVEIARARAGSPGTQMTHTSVADREAQEPITPTEAEVDVHLLRPGRNVLAILGLNRSLRSSDFSLHPALWAMPPPGGDVDRRSFRAFRARAAQRPDAKIVRYLDARLESRRGERDRALASLDALIASDPDSPELLLAWVETALLQGGAERAAARLHDALEGPLAKHAALWDAWLRVVSRDLKLSGQQLIARWPRARGSASVPRGEEMAWAVERMAREGAIRIRAGEGKWTDARGREWSADRFHSGGSPSRTILSNPISGTDAEPLFVRHRLFARSEMWSGYRIPCPRGKYRVSLGFAEVYYTRPGQRVFGVRIQGRKALDDFDPIAEAGASTALWRVFEAEVEDGFLEIQLVPEVDYPMISAIEVQRL
ncbi:MAG TPA: malectin domain-containing carbohydrate-binding protein, partial [Planctomycetota bacterium]|nr:malectin domain-containing carbohydrate-binding protein [Planctomycetota bacterium]